MRESLTAHDGPRARLVLDHGIDEQFVDSDIAVDERGMRFRSRWEFPLGTELAVSCQWHHPRLGWRQIRMEGVVVWCECQRRSTDGKAFDTAVLFLELPDDLRQSLREFSFELAAA
jgi:hypothetical protein